MNCYRAGKSFLRCFKLHHLNTRFISEIQKKITNSYYFMYGDAMLSSSRIGQIIDNSADQCGDSPAVVSVHQNISKTYSELRNEAERLASGLISIGLRKGDRIAICSPNCYEWPLTQFAAAKAGLILVNINPASQPMELEYCLKKVGCKALVMWDVLKTQDYYKILCDIIPDLPKSRPGGLKNSKLPNLEHIIMISETKKDGTLSLKDVLDSANKESDVKLSEVEKLVQFDDPANIQFTSGTTGTPKGAVLTHHNLVNNALLSGRRFGFNLYKPVVCCHLPLFHSFGCSVVFGTPTMYVDMIRHFKAGEFNIGSLKQGIIGGAAANASLVKDIREILDIPHLMVGYGATETSPAVSSTRFVEDFENVMNGVMQLVEYAEVKIVDSKGQLLPVKGQGELCVRGHNTFLGYWDDEEKTAEVLDKTHWYHTGARLTSCLARTADRTPKTFALQGDPSRSTHTPSSKRSPYIVYPAGRDITRNDLAHSWRIFSPNRDIEKIPAPLRSHISSPRSGVQTGPLSVISYLPL
ncbi:Acyl-CoA synthetase family member 2, mitochondrial [Araneus ventricosus]|uniref:Medium-chain acyl-CoA ligase ACSF2, mitochondrial n=1 Tax=Araneus ventricosus TaxID=182803 RepID=A0A4Y2QSF2_ARAVE|nr:Acyl-CoA synthetase family member 2, mitochondrial [Araneus ventricosus]